MGFDVMEEVGLTRQRWWVCRRYRSAAETSPGPTKEIKVSRSQAWMRWYPIQSRKP